MIQRMQLSMLKGSRSLILRPVTVTTARLMGTAVVGLLMLTTCASSAPSADLLAAEMAIADADRAGVADYSSVELNKARDKLTAALNAIQLKEMGHAQRLAQEARVDAELASALAEVARDRMVNEKMQKSIDVLKPEMQRNTGEKI